MGNPLFIASRKSDVSIKQFVRYFENSKFSIIFNSKMICAGAIPLVETGSYAIASSVTNMFQNVVLYGEYELPVLIGGLAFDSESAQWEGFKQGNFLLYKYTLQSHENEVYLIYTSQDRISEDVAMEHLRSLEHSILNHKHVQKSATSIKEVHGNYEEWEQQVNKVLEMIEKKEVDKVVLSTSLKLKGSFDVINTLETLIDLYPNTTIFAVNQDRCFLGATPEELLSLTGDTVHTMALAGSSPPDDDTLIYDTKTLHEHRIVIEDITSKLKNICFDIEVGNTCIFKLPYINHLQTPISARTYLGVDIVKLAKILHPTPALGGKPRDAALAILRKLEGHNRGWYGGAVGYIDHTLKGALYVAIRSALVDHEHTEIFAGAGIVKGSNPRKEWEEIHAKFQPLLKALR